MIPETECELVHAAHVVASINHCTHGFVLQSFVSVQKTEYLVTQDLHS